MFVFVLRVLEYWYIFLYVYMWIVCCYVEWVGLIDFFEKRLKDVMVKKLNYYKFLFIDWGKVIFKVKRSIIWFCVFFFLNRVIKEIFGRILRIFLYN